MPSLTSLSSERFRTTFFVFYASSVLLPILILLFLIIQYVRPVLLPHQLLELENVFTYGLAGMMAIPLLGFLLMFWWIQRLEELTEQLKLRTAELYKPSDDVIKEKDEIKALNMHFDGLYGELKGKIDQVRQVSEELERSKKKLNQMAVTDELTTLFNRRYFNRRLLEEIKRAQKKKSNLALVMIDINQFKKYNQANGVEAGDHLLNSMGLLIRDYVRKPDIAFRYGGDEFSIIIPGASIEEAASKAQKLSEAASRITIQGSNKGQPARASISCGVVAYADRLEGLIVEPERCLNQALAAGRGKVVCLTPMSRDTATPQ